MMHTFKDVLQDNYCRVMRTNKTFEFISRAFETRKNDTTYVSRKRSAKALRLICSFLAATSVKIICSGLTPCAAATVQTEGCHNSDAVLYFKYMTSDQAAKLYSKFLKGTSHESI